MLFVLGVLCLSLGGLWFRLFCLQALHCDKFRELAGNLHTRKVTIPAVRGKIYDRRGEILAISVPAKSVFASPAEITDPAATASALARALSLEKSKVEANLTRRPESHFAWIKRIVTADEEAAVRALRLDGVYMRDEVERFYPCGKALAQVIGFAGVDQQGLSGAEFAYESTLTGRDGFRREYRDALARTISNPSLVYVPAVDGASVVLTVDSNIQDFLESALERCYNSHRPKSVTGIVLDPQTGDVLALSQRPTFEPGRYADYPEDTWRLRAVTDSFEPGSMFKPFVFSAALEEGLVRLDDTIFCENGVYRVGGRTLHDHHPYGNLSAMEVVVKSSNIGMAKIGQRLGPAACYSYLRSFGFGRETGLSFPGEACGQLEEPAKWTHYTITSVPMGHEVSVNAMQMAAAFSVFANGGYLVEPRLLRGVIGPDGRTLEKHFEPGLRRRVLSKETAHVMVTRVLREVVTHGTGRLAELENYTVAGKTGTAQKIVDGQYSHSKYISSFICTGPVREARAVVLVVVDEPSSGPGRFGGTVAAPYAAEVLEATLDYIYIDTHRRDVQLRLASADVAGGTPSGEGADAP